MTKRPLRGTLIYLLVTICFLGVSAWAAPPYPQSTFITDITWAPVSAIVRKGSGNDTWPITWADDGDLYTAFGDGRGFIPKVPNKLSMGLAKVAGGPENPVGTNIRSSSGEQLGDGRTGKKASGMLMVDGTLFMWVRNANNDGEQCQLAWSSDHAQSWTFTNWKFPEFGYCTFLNFGQNYSGARDNFVYMYSPDGPSAYRPVDHMILTRVPKNDIANRNAYEFFEGIDANGNPSWSAQIADRGPVFTHVGLSSRSGITYNAPLGRYLWWQQLRPNGDTRFSGGFGVYEAAQPWGPWRTVYFTENWDVGPGETGSFPTKWMSADGKTVNLVFSGDDNFSVREAVLTIANETARPNPPEDLTATN